MSSWLSKAVKKISVKSISKIQAKDVVKAVKSVASVVPGGSAVVKGINAIEKAVGTTSNAVKKSAEDTKKIITAVNAKNTETKLSVDSNAAVTGINSDVSSVSNKYVLIGVGVIATYLLFFRKK
jgi:hypothetical protein